MNCVSFQDIFQSQNGLKDKFLSRVFGIFSENIVRIWCSDSRSPYQDLGRPTIRMREEKRGRTLDFTFQSQHDAHIFVGELKCELEYENYRYLTLTSSSQLDHHTGEAFARFLEAARNSGKCVATVGGKIVPVSGAILVWGRVHDATRAAVIQENKFKDILSVEEMISNLLEWDNKGYTEMIRERANWCDGMFKQLTAAL